MLLLESRRVDGNKLQWRRLRVALLESGKVAGAGDCLEFSGSVLPAKLSLNSSSMKSKCLVQAGGELHHCSVSTVDFEPFSFIYSNSLGVIDCSALQHRQKQQQQPLVFPATLLLCSSGIAERSLINCITVLI